MDKELTKLLDSFNDNKKKYDRESTVVDMFRRTVENYPDNEAVIFKDKRLTYGEVDSISDALAVYLLSKGMGRGKVVAVLIPRCELMVTVSLGIMKTGAAYLPLDPAYPDERLSFMRQDAAADIIIAADELKERAQIIGNNSAEIFPASEIEKLNEVEKDTNLLSAAPKPADLFMLIYTSGTTGVPKGVRLLHKNVMAYCAWYRGYFNNTPEWHVTCYNSYGFDGSIADMYPSLTVGACIVVIPEEMKLDLPELAETIRKEHIILADLPSQVGRQFALTMDCPELKYIVVGGERLSPFEPRFPYIVVNEYGPTESTVSITAYNVTKFEEDYPIGKPNDNTAIYIVDEDGKRVPPGMKGELCVAGVQVTGGYLNRPEATAKSFIKNPFSDDPDYAVLYKTGDVASYEEDGTIRFHGRRDGLVKIRGFRIELGEVEGVLRSHPDVKDVAVVAWDAPRGGQMLAAYIVSDKELNKDELSSFITKDKPPYMVPAYFERIERIPLNQNGKLNKKALPQPDFKESANEYKEPSNEIERDLCKGFERALGLEKVSADADFFEIGGDSLSVMRLISECSKHLLSFKILYEGRSPEGIAKILEKRDMPISLEGSKKEGHFFGPLHRQHYDWGNEIEEGYGLHCDATIHLGRKTDPEKLAEAVRQVILAHPAVDARLREAEDGSLRWFWDEKSLDDFKVIPERIVRSDYDELRKNIRKSMNLPNERMFLMRIFIIEEPDGTESTDFYFDFLHPIIDGDSIEIFIEDVNAAYSGQIPEKEKFSVLDYYDQIEGDMDSEDYKKEVEWNDKFTDSFSYKKSELRGDLDPGDDNHTLDTFEKLDICLSDVDDFTEKYNVTEGSLLAAAFGFMQAKCNGESGAVTLTIYNARDDARFERTLGAIYRHYPLCVAVEDDMSGVDFVRQTEENILLCRAHALYSADPVPLITAFSYQGVDKAETFEFCGDMARYEEIEDYEYEVWDFFVHRREDGFYLNLTYNTLAYSDEFVKRFKKGYEDVIRGILSLKTIREIKKHEEN
ncbi:MAG: amino acid adenylation domain-containing protein [Oribacterium sp.]|nr:amino acid adenylation domain-containing protein [Oribacterium sp.]